MAERAYIGCPMPDQHIATLQLSANTGVKPAGQMNSGGPPRLLAIIAKHSELERVSTNQPRQNGSCSVWPDKWAIFSLLLYYTNFIDYINGGDYG
jgi:hypothetical protein